MSRDEKHVERLLTSPPETLGRADFIERRSIMQERRKEAVKTELKLLAPLDMRRRHKKNKP